MVENAEQGRAGYDVVGASDIRRSDEDLAPIGAGGVSDIVRRLAPSAPQRRVELDPVEFDTLARDMARRGSVGENDARKCEADYLDAGRIGFAGGIGTEFVRVERPFRQIEIRQMPNGTFSAWWRGEMLPVDVSLTHAGSWGGGQMRAIAHVGEVRALGVPVSLEDAEAAHPDLKARFPSMFEGAGSIA